MSDEPKATLPQPAEPVPAPDTQGGNNGFPSEPFPCPHCGQMLGPKVRVCVACRKPIDPSQIQPNAPEAPAFAPSAGASREPARSALTWKLPQRAGTSFGAATDARPKARFSWGIFAMVAVVAMVLLSVVETRFGAQKALYVYWGAQLLSTAWVFYDARQKGIPRPLRWTISALLIWLPFFSWYLARRRQPQAVCEPIEGETGPFLRVLLLVTGFTVLAALLLTQLASALHVLVPK